MPEIANKKPEWKLNADPKRHATDALRGYVYQARQTLHAWLDLRNSQVLYAEEADSLD